MGFQDKMVYPHTKKVKLKTIQGEIRDNINIKKNHKNGNCKAGGFPLMPHDTPSSRCTPSGWCERPR